jgi:hypothetical protein
MTDIKLDPKKLLGFKIIAAGGSATKVRSPKIGAKGCVPGMMMADEIAAAVKAGTTV